MAAIAAISEELIFRRVIQKLIQKHSNNIHLAIWITAFLFSAIHLQFYGFVPRMLLGAVLGYMYFWSGSIWMPIIAHFTNNFIGVTLAFLVATGKVDPTIENTIIEQVSFPVLSVLLSATLLWQMRKQNKSVL